MIARMQCRHGTHGRGVGSAACRRGRFARASSAAVIRTVGATTSAFSRRHAREQNGP
jgi:hypothetical protein